MIIEYRPDDATYHYKTALHHKTIHENVQYLINLCIAADLDHELAILERNKISVSKDFYHLSFQGFMNDLGQLESKNGYIYDLIGSIYRYSLGVRTDYGQGAIWYTKAVTKENGIAMNNLGYMTQYGKGVPKSLRAAIRLYETAIDKGSRHAITNLGTIYYNGSSTEGIQKDYRLAIHYCMVAVTKGSTKAKEMINKIDPTGILQELIAETDKLKKENNVLTDILVSSNNIPGVLSVEI